MLTKHTKRQQRQTEGETKEEIEGETGKADKRKNRQKDRHIGSAQCAISFEVIPGGVFPPKKGS